MLKVKGHDALYRDVDTKAIINTSSDYVSYIEQRNSRMIQAQEIIDLKSEVYEMKILINSLINKISAD